MRGREAPDETAEGAAPRGWRLRLGLRRGDGLVH